MRTAIFLDAGHGGLDNKGRYTTAPGKMFRHPGQKMTIRDWFYEGVKNRIYVEHTIQKLSAQLAEARLPCELIRTYHPIRDTPRRERIQLINRLAQQYDKCLVVSEHSNATKYHTARGFQVWTSRGQTESDIYAQSLIDYYKLCFGEWIDLSLGDIDTLEDYSDGDGDYEADFDLVKLTRPPAILIENLFFDQLQDASLLVNPTYIEQYTELLAHWLFTQVKDWYVNG